MEFRFFETESSWIETTAEEVFASCRNKENPVIGLSGGNTPKPLYTYLGTHWPEGQRAQIAVVDERLVPTNDPNSNTGMIENTLFTALQEKQKSLISFIHPKISGTPTQDAHSYSETLQELPRSWDMVVLGVGPDGHIASLFPESPSLKETTNLVVPTTTDIFAVRDRLSIALPVLLSTKKIILFLSPQKESVIEEIEWGTKTPEEFPVKYLLKHPNVLVHTLKQPH